MSDLTTVNNTLKEQNELLKGNKTQDLENKREQDRKDAEMLKILSNLKPTVNINGKESKDSFLMSVLKGFGLIGAGAAGLAAGLLVGWLEFVATLIGKVGKFLFKLIDKIPRPKWLDDFLAAFKKEGKIGKIFTSIKNFFIGEASIFKRIGKLVDSAVDGLKSFTGGIFGKIKNFFMGETSIFKRIGKLVDSAVDGLKSFTGGLFGKIKNFFTSETSIFKRIGKLVDSAVDTVKGFTGGIFTKIGNFFTGEASIFKRIAKILDPIIDSVKGFSGGIFTKIGNFFGGETSIFKRMKAAIDPVIDIVKGMSGGIFTTIGNVFQSIKNFGATLAAPFKSIGELLGMGGDAAKVTKGGGGIFKTIMSFLSPMKSVFKGLASLGKIIAAPLTIIMGLIDAGFETKDAVDKSKGFFATILNGIFGAIGGFIDGAIMQVADLLKSGISWIAGFFGFTEIEKTLDSFSFSKIWNEFLDKVYKFVNTMFNNPMELIQPVIDFFKDFFSLDNLKKLVTSALGGGVIDSGLSAIGLGEDTPEEKAAEVEALKAQLAEAKKKKVTGTSTLFNFTQEEKNEEIAELLAEIKELTPKAATGGLISSAGIYNLHKGEMVMDEIAVKGFEKALNLVNMSQQNAQAAAGGGGQPVIINNNNVDNSMQSSQTTAVSIPAPTRSNESTLRALQAA